MAVELELQQLHQKDLVDISATWNTRIETERTQNGWDVSDCGQCGTDFSECSGSNAQLVPKMEGLLTHIISTIRASSLWGKHPLQRTYRERWAYETYWTWKKHTLEGCSVIRSVKICWEVSHIFRLTIKCTRRLTYKNYKLWGWGDGSKGWSIGFVCGNHRLEPWHSLFPNITPDISGYGQPLPNVINWAGSNSSVANIISTGQLLGFILSITQKNKSKNHYWIWNNFHMGLEYSCEHVAKN